MTATATELEPRPRIDPKIRARRVAVKRARGRHRLRVLLALMVATTATAGAWLVIESPLLDVDRVDVSGASHSAITDIVAAAHVPVGAPLLRVDRADVAHRVERLPWVGRARVWWRLPGRLRVDVRERVPVASIPLEGGGFALLDAGARVLADVADRPPLPELQGLKGVPELGSEAAVARPALRVMAALPDDIARRVASITTQPEVTVRLRTGVDVRFGTIDVLTSKIAALEAVLGHLRERPMTYIDVRVPTAPVVG
jgi:cell division protein FtsQ